MITNPISDLFGVRRSDLVTVGVHVLVNTKRETIGELFLRGDHVVLRVGSFAPKPGVVVRV